MTMEADVLSPNALGAILTADSIAALRVPIVAGGANNQLATPAEGDLIHERGILYAPDYVINAGGIINVASEYLKDADEAGVKAKIEQIPGRLEQNLGGERRHRPQSGRGGGRHGPPSDRAQLLI
jgi:leucine dehydrogenase